MEAYPQPLIPFTPVSYTGKPSIATRSISTPGPVSVSCKAKSSTKVGYTHLVRKPAIPALLSAEQFIRQNIDLIGLPLPDLAQHLNQRLQTHPVHYANVLDAIALLRAFTPQVISVEETHYVLLMTGWSINGFVWLPAQSERPHESNNFIEYHSETRSLFRSVLTAGATKLFLASTRTDRDYGVYDSDGRQSEWLWATFDHMGIELVEYAFFYQDANISSVWARYGNEGLDDEVSIEALELHGIDVSSTTPFPGN